MCKEQGIRNATNKTKIEWRPPQQGNYIGELREDVYTDLEGAEISLELVDMDVKRVKC